MLGEIIGETIFYLVLNIVGGTIRWIYGTIWRTIFNKHKFEFKEYLYGPKKSKKDWDHLHTINNGIIGFVFIVLMVVLLS